MTTEIIGIIPARAGSTRVPNKNKVLINGHPMIAYTIESAKQSGVFAKLLLATDDDEIMEIGEHYGVEETYKRGQEDSTSTSLDIEWLSNLHNDNRLTTEYFAILRPTSPQRSVPLIRECLSVFLNSSCDSLRTISLVKEHPGKMWRIDENGRAHPYLTQAWGVPATHAKQYASLETLYVQNSVLEFAKTDVISRTNSREGEKVYGYVTSGLDSFAIDYVDDIIYLNYLLSKDGTILPKISTPQYKFKV